MWQTIADIFSNPAVEIVTHVLIVGVFILEVIQHWSHHRRNKKNRDEQLYTLDEAKVILFETVALADPEVFALPQPINFRVPPHNGPLIGHDIVKRG